MQGTRLMPSTRRQSQKTLGNAKVSAGPASTDQKIDDIFRSTRRAKLPSKAAAKVGLCLLACIVESSVSVFLVNPLENLTCRKACIFRNLYSINGKTHLSHLAACYTPLLFLKIVVLEAALLR